MTSANALIQRAKFEKHVADLVTRRPVSASDLKWVLILSRKILDAEACREQHPTLSFYCDWLVHDSLNRKAKLALLVEITSALQRNADNESGRIVRQINELLGLDKLRAELLKLHSNAQNCTDLFASLRNWTLFIRALLDELSEQPVEIPFDSFFRKDRFGEFARKLVAEHGGSLIAGQLKIILKPEDSDLPPDKKNYFWRVRLLDHPGSRWTVTEEDCVYISGPLNSPENRDQFLFD